MSIEPPPLYTPSPGDNGSGSIPPPAYTFPESFRIGDHQTPRPLVTPAQLEIHLSLLNAFAELRRKVEELTESEAPYEYFPKEKERRWGWLVSFAVERFALWCGKLKDEKEAHQWSGQQFLPPLDVLMVWHSYLLNPEWYAEDSLRIPEVEILSKLGESTGCPLLPNLSSILNNPPTADRVVLWERLTLGRRFDIFHDAAENPQATFKCSACSEWLHHSLVRSDGKGYLQQKFSAECTSCHAVNEKSSLCARKLAQDIARSDDSTRSYLAGTVRTNRLAVDNRRAQAIQNDIMASERFVRPRWASDDNTWADHIAKTHDYGIHNLRNTLTNQLTPSHALVNRIMSAYSTEHIFSLDLTGAVLRQSSFVEKMHGLRWTEPDYFAGREDRIALQHVIARYHAFLDLMSSVNGIMCVPTLDIDLAWHTHQLLGPRYSEDCKFYVGRYVDHDDKVGENTLANAFDETSRAWQARFGVAYTHCGCPVPGETIGQRLHRLRSKFSSTPATYLVPPESIADRRSTLAATHPSDHNSIGDMGSTLRLARERERLKRLTKQEKTAKKNRTSVDRGHDPAFLTPVPTYAYYPACIGQPPPPPPEPVPCTVTCGSRSGGSGSACSGGGIPTSCGSSSGGNSHSGGHHTTSCSSSSGGGSACGSSCGGGCGGGGGGGCGGG